MLFRSRPYLSNDVSADGFILSEKGSVRGFDKVVAAPILNSHAQPLGCILVHNRKDQRDFYAEDVSMLELLAGSAGSRLELLDSESDLERMVEEMNEIKSRYTSLKRKLELV